MKIEITEDYLTQNVTVWLLEDDQGSNIFSTFHFEGGQMIGVSHEKNTCEINEDQKPLMTIQRKFFYRFINACVEFADRNNIKIKNQIDFEKMIDTKNDQIQFAQDMSKMLIGVLAETMKVKK